MGEWIAGAVSALLGVLVGSWVQEQTRKAAARRRFQRLSRQVLAELRLVEETVRRHTAEIAQDVVPLMTALPTAAWHLLLGADEAGELTEVQFARLMRFYRHVEEANHHAALVPFLLQLAHVAPTSTAKDYYTERARLGLQVPFQRLTAQIPSVKRCLEP